MSRALWLLLWLQLAGWLRYLGRNLGTVRGALLALVGLVVFVPWLIAAVARPGGAVVFVPADLENGAIFFVLYVNAEWFAPNAASALGLRFGRTHFKRTAHLNKQIRRTAALVCGAPSLSSLDCELRQLIDACHAESWQQSQPPREARTTTAVTDFRVRKCIRLMSESPGAEIELDSIARESGLSRPHFYRLFRTQTGVTPHLYLNTLIMENALDALVTSEAPVAGIGYDLGFSSQSAFTRFFAANVGMPPTDYRRAKVLRP